METKLETKVNKKENQLVIQLRNDKKLCGDKELQQEYLSMALAFVSNLKDNLSKGSIELNETIPNGIDTWRDFLSYPIVRKYIQSFRDEQIINNMDAGLMKGDRDALGIQKAMQGRGPAVNNSNIILIRLPEKVDFE